MEETDGTLLPDDVIREILLRVPTDDVASLFRYAVTCKQWRAVVADLSFLRQHWPKNTCHPSSLLGFFEKRYRKQGMPFFFPISPGSVLGPRPRSLASVFSGAPLGNMLNGAVPLAARGGLLLLHLAGDSFHLAVCDVLTGTCHLLPPLECTVSHYGCAILAHEDLCSLDGEQVRTPLTGYSAFFKVLAIVIGNNDHDYYYLYTFSSSQPNWSEPRKCFDEVVSQRATLGLLIVLGTNRAVVCRGVAHWLGSYTVDQWNIPRYFTICINVKTRQISLTELSIPANELAASGYGGLLLSVTVDERLSLVHLQKEGLQLNTWAQGDDGTWLRTRVIKLKPPKQARDPTYVPMLSGEKSGVLFMADLNGHVHKTNPETGVMEDVTTEMFQDSLGIMAVPMEIDWPALFMSRLAV